MPKSKKDLNREKSLRLADLLGKDTGFCALIKCEDPKRTIPNPKYGTNSSQQVQQKSDTIYLVLRQLPRLFKSSIRVFVEPN